MKRLLTICAAVLVTAGFVVTPAMAFEPPVITLDRVEVASIQPFFVKPKLMKPDKEDPKKKVEFVGKYGYSSTMNVAYVWNVKNPNKEPIMLDELSFTIMFDGFEVNTVTSYDDGWIPAGKTDQLRVIATNEAFPTIVSLMVGAGNVERVQELKTSAGGLTKKWFTTIADFTFPIEISNGNAVFVDEKGKQVRAQFTGKWGKAGEAKKAEGSVKKEVKKVEKEVKKEVKKAEKAVKNEKKKLEKKDDKKKPK
ncbi:hypothetical protein ACFL2Q_12385 [Thermodesulfobacteriota bacterium]